MFPKVPINREKCICEILRKNVKDALVFWKRLYIKGFLRVGNFSYLTFITYILPQKYNKFVAKQSISDKKR